MSALFAVAHRGQPLKYQIAAMLFCILRADPKAAPEPEAPVERLVAQLGSASWAEREGASEKLLSLGKAAEAALERALTSPDPEIRQRARRLLDRIAFDAPGALPERIAGVMRHYASLSDRERSSLLADVVRELRHEAVPVLVRALRSELSPAVRSVALMYLVSLDRERGEAELRELARIERAAAWAWASLGELFVSQGRDEKAVEAFENARRAGSKEERVAEALAGIYARKAEWAKARALYAELVALDPENGHYRLNLGRCHHMLGDAAGAEATWREAVKRKGGDPSTFVWLAAAYEGIGAKDKAIAALREGCTRHPEACELLRRLAWTLAEEGKLDEAIEVYQRAARAAQSDYERRAINAELTGRLQRGGLLAGYVRREEADLARLDAEIAALLRKLAERHLQANRGAAARETLERLVALYPGSPDGRWAAEKLRELEPGKAPNSRKEGTP
jgi:tetratricopeptide (TPR) repeat protein